jgi:hypothetical protein
MYGELDTFDNDYNEHDGSVLWFKASEEDWEVAQFYEALDKKEAVDDE